MEVHVFKDSQQHGPFSEDELLSLLREGSINKTDLIFYEGLGEWRPLEEIFDVEEAIEHFMDEGQDPALVAEVYQQVSPILSSHEEIFYIAHQKPKMLKNKPDAVVVTNERLLIIRHGLGGSRVMDYQWKGVSRVEMRETLMGNTFTLIDNHEHAVQVDDLPKGMLEKLCKHSHEMRAACV